MNAEMLLQHAAGVVEDRRDRYGEPGPLFERIAARWSQDLGCEVTAAQVALWRVHSPHQHQEPPN